MLQAMNTGPEGSMTTVHANSSRDAISRLETMVLMAGFELPVKAIREQIASAIDLILQVSRLPDGRRVITAVTEVQGLEGDIILLQDIFRYRSLPGAAGGATGELVATGLRPKLVDKLNEANVELPAAVFKTPAGMAPGGTSRPSATSRGRKVRVPSAREVADQERLR
jgi:pilus assembly protein CpaF